MSDKSLQARILTELSYTNLSTARLAAILNVRVSELKTELYEMEEAKLVRHIERDEEKKWEALA